MVKIPQCDVSFVGLAELSLEEQVRLKELVKTFTPKFESKLKNMMRLQVHIKVHEPDGRKKYSLHIHLSAPGTSFVSDKHHGYELQKVMHSALDAMLKEIDRRVDGKS